MSHVQIATRAASADNDGTLGPMTAPRHDRKPLPRSFPYQAPNQTSLEVISFQTLYIHHLNHYLGHLYASPYEQNQGLPHLIWPIVPTALLHLVEIFGIVYIRIETCLSLFGSHRYLHAEYERFL
jgi:hypothetical protein